MKTILPKLTIKPSDRKIVRESAIAWNSMMEGLQYFAENGLEVHINPRIEGEELKYTIHLSSAEKTLTVNRKSSTP